MNVKEFSRPPFLAPESCKDGDIITFKSEGMGMEFKNGGKGVRVDVELNGTVIPYTMYEDVVAVVIAKFGEDSSNWIDKQAEITLRPYVDKQNQDREAIVLTPIVNKELIDEKDIPVVGEKADDNDNGGSDPDPAEKEEKDGKVNVKNIPF